MKPITLKIQAGKSDDVAVSGDYVRVKSASVPVRVEADEGQVDATIEQGDALNLQPFTRLRVSHSDAAEQTIVLLIGNGTSADSARVGGAVDVKSLPAPGVAVTQGYMATLADAQVVAANPARKLLRIQNVGAVDVFLTFNGLAATAQGFKLAPGASELYDYSMSSLAVRAYSATASALAFMEG